MSFISSFEIIKVIVRKAEDEGRPDPNIFLCFFMLILKELKHF